ncbi:hypothetical protein FOL47_007256 [Perkinsus chesapeaki]|uniref:Uncharacterized protein n=1 Tax=Perkinsus chesapeaki TaxID=330153 RepID=A0A7J6LLX0_PERCH|nr:hypothetical protein FOL47_007256 [Perkinsus chesapeaki]
MSFKKETSRAANEAVEALNNYRRLIQEDCANLHRDKVELKRSKKEHYDLLKVSVIRQKAIERAKKPKNRPPWTYADAPGYRIGTDPQVNSEPSKDYIKNPDRMGIYSTKGVPPPHERRRSMPLIKEFSYTAKGNEGGYFDPKIGRLSDLFDTASSKKEKQTKTESLSRPPWSSQPFTLDYFDKEMAKESLRSRDELKGMRFAQLAISPDRTHDYSMPDFIAGDGETKSFWRRPDRKSDHGNECLRRVQYWQRHHLRSGIAYWKKVDREYNKRLKERKQLVEQLRKAAYAQSGREVGSDSCEESPENCPVDLTGSSSARSITLRIALREENDIWKTYTVVCDEDGTVGGIIDELVERLGMPAEKPSILTSPSQRRVLMAAGDRRQWGGGDLCRDLVSSVKEGDNLYLIEKLTAPYQLPYLIHVK